MFRRVRERLTTTRGSARQEHRRRAQRGADVYYSAPDRTIFKLLDVARGIFNNRLAGVQNILEEIRLDQAERARGAIAASDLRTMLVFENALANIRRRAAS